MITSEVHSHLRVAVGVLTRDDGKVLIGQRVKRDAYFAKWEFPGGKLEEGESPSQALVRELNEELGIRVGVCVPLMELQHTYPDRSVHLFIQRVERYDGEPVSKEGQALQWVATSELRDIDFLAGNTPIIDALCEGILNE